ncbi:TolC family protein [Hymenobacter aerilatus]|uniref:TolC family protein n=1 Tax=Hymenobacter aerilatus TaxID=2932251 RepID=A0A8T9SST6_9BACT|nr:TolC family protein [Hymenobacter aerilatus]UOR05208.1 TolC family protein [Hymenobacter aerilatus]
MKRFLLFFLFLPLGAQAQLPEVLPLDSILARVERVHPRLRQYEAQAKAADAYAAGARVWMAPKVGAGPFMVPYSANRRGEDMGMQSGGSVMVMAEQGLPNRARQRANESYLRSQASVDRETRAYTRNQLRADVKQNYYDWLMLQKKLHVLEKTERLMEFALRSIELRYKYGGEKLSDAYRAQAALQLHHVEEMELEGQLKERRANLNTLLVRDPQTLFDIDTTYHLRALDRSLDTTELAEARSDVRALDQSLVRNQLQQQLERTAARPEFAVQAQHMQGLGSMPNQYTVLGTMSVPFVPWASRQYKANVAGMQLEAQALREQRADLLNQAAGKVEALNARRRAQYEQVLLYQQSVLPAVLKSYRATLLAYEQNTETFSAVLQAWETLRNTRLAAVDQEQQLLQLQVEFEREQEQ